MQEPKVAVLRLQWMKKYAGHTNGTKGHGHFLAHLARLANTAYDQLPTLLLGFKEKFNTFDKGIHPRNPANSFSFSFQHIPNHFLHFISFVSSVALVGHTIDPLKK